MLFLDSQGTTTTQVELFDRNVDRQLVDFED